MHKNTFLIIQPFYQNWNNLPTAQRFQTLHNVYKKCIKQLLTYNLRCVCFINLENDAFDTLAIADELINKNIVVTYLDDSQNELFANKIDSIYDAKQVINNHLIFTKKTPIELNKIDLLIIPTIINYDGAGFVFNSQIINFINKFNSFKLGISLKNNTLTPEQFGLIHDDYNFFLKFDKLILV